MKKPPAKSTIEVQGVVVSIVSQRAEDFISLTDIARFKDAYTTDDLIRNWLRNRNTIEFLGIWERLNNPGFNPVEFDGFRMQAGLNSFAITPKQWIERTGAIGITCSTSPSSARPRSNGATPIPNWKATSATTPPSSNSSSSPTPRP